MRMSRLVWMISLLLGCAEPSTTPEPPINAAGPGRHEVMYAVRSPTGDVIVGGFDGAAPQGATIEVRSQGPWAPAVDAHEGYSGKTLGFLRFPVGAGWSPWNTHGTPGAPPRKTYIQWKTIGKP